MHARDASGRQVSLLNEDAASRPHYQLPYSAAPTNFPYHASFARSDSSSPNTPELLRSDSYDSQMSSEPLSPVTPGYDYGRVYATAATINDPRYAYEDYPIDPSAQSITGSKRPRAYSDSRSASYEDEGVSPPGERSGKRYPCRYRDSHGCEKTFTTSGHASRHSKIHTAEKAVPCTFAGCTKKFTRADNMKQHLETHYKDKSRSSSSRPGVSSSDRKAPSGKSSSRTKVAPSLTPLPSPGGVWDMRELGVPLFERPSTTARTPSSGLDALAMAIACQEGA
ncbi:hypothetical protein B0T22DRAFT_78502 [Podospora appendiculata]|uniref:C2H2 type master regulator of conidiophore development brlA n=1 Tax=Podospora appendiculata TaxID=314037 RepID=A0AAE0XJX2_9PEZI|nr:hypothetical protein B0T22DRAFT_78502 [Podospora appendiculata]